MDKPEETKKPDINDFIDDDLSDEEKARLYSNARKEDSAESEPTAEPTAETAEEKEEFRVPRGPENSGSKNSFEVYKNSMEALLPPVEISPTDLAEFEEHIILNTDPYATDVDIAGSTIVFKFRIRVRMAHEYRLIYMLVAAETKANRLPDYPAMLTRMQELAMAVMLLSVGEKSFPSTGLLPNPWQTAEQEGASFDIELEKAYKELRRRTTEKVDCMSQPLFMLALDAFRIFEARCFKMMPDIMAKPFPQPGQPRSS